MTNVPRWLVGVGSALVAAMIGYVFYTNLRDFVDEQSAQNFFVLLGMAGLLLMLGATAWQRWRS